MKPNRHDRRKRTDLKRARAPHKGTPVDVSRYVVSRHALGRYVARILGIADSAEARTFAHDELHRLMAEARRVRCSCGVEPAEAYHLGSCVALCRDAIVTTIITLEQHENLERHYRTDMRRGRKRSHG